MDIVLWRLPIGWDPWRWHRSFGKENEEEGLVLVGEEGQERHGPNGKMMREVSQEERQDDYVYDIYCLEGGTNDAAGNRDTKSCSKVEHDHARATAVTSTPRAVRGPCPVQKRT